MSDGASIALETLKSFNVRCSQDDGVSREDLTEICSVIQDIDVPSISKSTVVETVQHLSYRSLDEDECGKIAVQSIETLIDRSGLDITDDLISRLIPMLPRIDRNTDKKMAGLNPQFGLSFEEDEARQIWKANGGTKCLPLFYVILLHLKHQNVSSNLWWMTPGLLNILDDSTDLLGVRLKGVLLLKIFLEKCFVDDEHWISFHDTGLYALYEPILLSMCYCLPPGYSSKDSLAIWRIVFPTLNSIYSLQFKRNQLAYQHHLGNFLSQLLLQNVIPRINITDEKLTEFALETLIKIIKTLKVSIVAHLQRIIYTLGEYMVRNAFFTAFTSLVDKTIEVFSTLIEECPTGRINAHKYDLLAIILITFEKCQKEGKMTGELTLRLRQLIINLECKGCNLTNDKIEILKIKDMREILS